MIVLAEVAQHIDTAMIIGCYLAIIGLYVYVFKSNKEIMLMLHRHENESNKHVKSEDLVYKDVCELQVKRFEERINEVKEDVSVVKSDIKDVKSDIKAGFNEMKQLLKVR